MKPNINQTLLIHSAALLLIYFHRIPAHVGAGCGA